MILGFKKQFKEPILAGVKLHTMREDEHDRWHAGVVMHQATGVRTKEYDCFNLTKCTGTEKVFMTYDHMLHISVEGFELSYPDRLILAKNDGFEKYLDFELWFYKAIKKSPKDCFSGKIIHWTDFRYKFR
jgi:hypothetical protein